MHSNAKTQFMHWLNKLKICISMGGQIEYGLVCILSILAFLNLTVGWGFDPYRNLRGLIQQF